MTTRNPWSVKGIKSKAKEAALEAARAEGLTLGDYLNKLILKEKNSHANNFNPKQSKSDHLFHNEKPPSNRVYNGSEADIQQQADESTELFAQRLDAAEARSALAITGINQSVMGLVSRLDNGEEQTQSYIGRIDAALEDLRSTQEHVSQRIANIEADDTAQKNLAALRSLENTLSRLSAHVYEEEVKLKSTNDLLRKDIETGFSNIQEGMASLTDEVDQRLNEAVDKANTVVESAELRTEGAVRHLSDRMSGIENTITQKLTVVETKTEERWSRIQDDAEARLKKVETVITQTVQEVTRRLNAMEDTSMANMDILKHEMQDIDERLNTLKNVTGPQAVEALRENIELRFETTSNQLSKTIADLRNEIADQIETAVRTGRPDTLNNLEASLVNLQKKLHTNEERQAQIVDTFGKELNRVNNTVENSLKHIEASSMDSRQIAKSVQEQMEQLSNGLYARLTQLESGESLRDQFDQISSQVQKQVSESEKRNTDAIEQVSDQISRINNRLQTRHDKSIAKLAEQIDLYDKGIRTEIDELKDSTQSYIDNFDEYANSALEPIQTAISSLTERLYTIENHPNLTDNARASELAEQSNNLADEIPPSGYHQDNGQGFHQNAQEWPSDPSVNINAPDWQTPNTADGYLNGNSNLVDNFSNAPPTSPYPEQNHLSGEPNSFNTSHAPHSNETDGRDDYLFRVRNAVMDNADNALSNGSAPETGNKGSIFSNKITLTTAATVTALTIAGGTGYFFVSNQDSNNLPHIYSSNPVNQDFNTDALPNDLTNHSDNASTERSGAVESSTRSDMNTQATQPANKPEYSDTGITTSNNPAPETLEQAAAQSMPLAQYELGLAKLDSGDISAAVSLIRKSALQNFPMAQYQMAKLHEEGLGLARDNQQARIWAEKAANAGNVKAMYDLALFFANGEGVPRSYAAAVEWFHKAADYGMVDSQYNLGILYEQGLGVSPNLSEALYWFEVAKGNGDSGAAQRISQLNTRLSAAESESVRIRAQKYKTKISDPTANGRFGLRPWQSTSGDPVLITQNLLTKLGYNPGPIDGMTGNNTRIAILNFEKANGMQPTGQVSDELISKLDAAVEGMG